MSHELCFRNMNVKLSDTTILFWTVYQKKNVHLNRIKLIKGNKTDKEFTVQNINCIFQSALVTDKESLTGHTYQT